MLRRYSKQKLWEDISNVQVIKLRHVSDFFWGDAKEEGLNKLLYGVVGHDNRQYEHIDNIAKVVDESLVLMVDALMLLWSFFLHSSP
ncbi:hypothetical protein L6452_31004 [Arctium lappa]|uniref:Uncharacterized protein n=1 Tax=Arctium lappa TaxID=4217 RepID=A0ACB8ZKN5_ARCLA|nr:hypothetical protein L6452_31004 [Arctium lappa]